jgi:2-polyprenyl-3-methyl-5-hydroxy-6-metoxy-1,4-benzoquinol methylase
MKSVPLPTEFHWSTEHAANGASGEGLAKKIIAIVKQFDDARTICDLGCGNGYISGRLSTLGYEVTGVDASRSGLGIARREYPRVKFVGAQIDGQLRSRLDRSAFDLVISSDVIEHLYRPADLLDAAAQLLKPGGPLIVGTPYHGYLKNLVLALAGKMDAHFSVLHDGGHIKFFSVKTLTQLIESHSFTDVRFEFYGRTALLWKNMICIARKADNAR